MVVQYLEQLEYKKVDPSQPIISQDVLSVFFFFSAPALGAGNQDPRESNPNTWEDDDQKVERMAHTCGKNDIPKNCSLGNLVTCRLPINESQVQTPDPLIKGLIKEGVELHNGAYLVKIQAIQK